MVSTTMLTGTVDVVLPDVRPPDVAPGVPHAGVETTQPVIPLAVVGVAPVVWRVRLVAPAGVRFTPHQVVGRGLSRGGRHYGGTAE